VLDQCYCIIYFTAAHLLIRQKIEESERVSFQCEVRSSGSAMGLRSTYPAPKRRARQKTTHGRNNDLRVGMSL